MPIEKSLGERRAIVGIGPRYWRCGFIKTYTVVFKGVEHTLPFTFEDSTLECVVVRGRDHYRVKHEDEVIEVECDPALSRVMKEADVVERISRRLADVEFENILRRRGIEAVVAWVIGTLERLIHETELDKLTKPYEIPIKVEEVKRRLEDELSRRLMETESHVEEKAATG